jgi:hypothetical protein
MNHDGQIHEIKTQKREGGQRNDGDLWRKTSGQQDKDADIGYEASVMQCNARIDTKTLNRASERRVRVMEGYDKCKIKKRAIE